MASVANNTAICRMFCLLGGTAVAAGFLFYFVEFAGQDFVQSLVVSVVILMAAVSTLRLLFCNERATSYKTPGEAIASTPKPMRKSLEAPEEEETSRVGSGVNPRDIDLKLNDIVTSSASRLTQSAEDGRSKMATEIDREHQRMIGEVTKVQRPSNIANSARGTD